MDVDPPSPPPEPEMPETTDAATLLRHALHPFIAQNLSRTLGSDLAPSFQPAKNATLPTLLRFLLKKWIGVFADSSLRNHRSEIESLLSETAKPRDESHEGILCEAVLVALGKSTLAARGAGSGRTGFAGRYGLEGVEGELVSGGTVERGVGGRMRVVLDGSNVGWGHGCGKGFSMRGAVEALYYYTTRGHATVLFLPAARLEGGGSGKEDLRFYEMVRGLRGGEMLVATPDRDYDDAYLVDFARRNCAVVVSNDRFEDVVYQAGAEGGIVAEGWRKWLAGCRVSFAFRGNEFIPNPAFSFDKAAKVAAEFGLT